MLRPTRSTSLTRMLTSFPPSPSCSAMLTLMHQGCGRSDDSRQFCISDLMAPIALTAAVGPSVCKMLTFVLRNGKYNRTGRPQYMGVTRHADLQQCAVYAMAKYLQQRFMGEEFPMPGTEAWWVSWSAWWVSSVLPFCSVRRSRLGK